MTDFFRTLFSSDGFMPHGHCYLWRPGVLWLHILSDACIVFSYYSIPITLIYLIRKRKDLPFDWIFCCFAVFIVACGTTHLMAIWEIWHPTYWLSGALKAVTGITSLLTAALLVKLLPQVISLPSPSILRKANEELLKTQKQLFDMSHQAGMAEVASGVLHNVGNALNSVNVSATLLANNLRQSKASNLFKAVELLKEHKDNLGGFFTIDSKGKQLPAYLEQLAKHLEEEHAAAIKELSHLRHSIEHIKDIVTTQQNYAKVSGLTETVSLRDLVEDALRMNESALARHDVELIREFSEVSPITVEKHKVLQILVNLIRNAKYACDESNRTDKQITVKICSSEERALIIVSDNGVGIPQENMIRIFNHGFTTRKDGHGFGLHSAILAAKEMGGVLIAQSEGPDKGASFTLELPQSRAS
jgi:signal transduction histidine kinase